MPNAAILAAFLALLATPAATLPPCPEDISAVWTECTGSIAYGSGATYVGEWLDDRMHGEGTYTWPDGATYVGEWRDDKRHGKGTHAFPYGETYVDE